MPPGILGHGTTDQSVASQLDVSQINDLLLGDGATYFVSLAGSDGNTGLSFDNAFRTIIHAVSVAPAFSTIIVGQGIFDETANGAAGIVLASPVNIYGSGGQTFITNSDTTDSGSVLTFASPIGFQNVWGCFLRKGETTSNNSIILKFDGAFSCNFADGSILLEKANFTGVQFTNGSAVCTFGSPLQISLRSVLSTVGGTGIDFDNSTNCVVMGDVALVGLSVGAQFTAPAIVNGLTEGVDITNCVIGAQINVGCVGNILNNRFTNCGTDIIDNSGNATNFRWGSITHLHDDMEFIPKFPGNIWVVDDANGLDTNSGHSPIESLQTISAAVTAASAGDAIIIRAGTYDEAVNLNKAGLQLWPQLGVILTNTTPGTPLTISANNCVVRAGGLIVSQAGQVGVSVTGAGCRLEEIIVSAATIGLDIDGTGAILLRANISGHTVTAMDISSSSCILEDIQAVGIGGATRGFYLSNAAADDNIFNRCISIGNGTASIEAVAGTARNTFKDFSSGGGDGRWIDADNANVFSNFTFDDRVFHTTTFTGAGPTTDNLFRIYGTVLVTEFSGDVETVLSNDIGNGYIELSDGAATIDVTDSPGPSFNSLPVATFLHKIDDNTVQIAIEDSSQVRLYEDATKFGQDPNFQITAKDGVATYIRLVYSGAGTSGAIHWHLRWEPLTENGFVEAI
jgi:hypothetical protein